MKITDKMRLERLRVAGVWITSEKFIDEDKEFFVNIDNYSQRRETFIRTIDAAIRSDARQEKERV